ncbi:MAG: histidinol-phosphatase [Lachnospiraceae bacterium]|nr:histidinol-phosphatase [Lachnospiraceae bacterium]
MDNRKGTTIMTKDNDELNIIANYHTHTTRCRHACGEDREYVEAAIETGLKILGFSDHTPYPTGTGFRSGMRILPEDVDGYFQSISDLKDEYKNDIEIHIGVEAEYFPEHFHKLLDLMKDYPLEYMILGNHFVPDEQHGIYVGCAFKDKLYLEQYTENVIAGIESGKFAYVAHPDLPLYVGEDSDKALSEAYRSICKSAKEHNVPLEINMLGHTRGIQYPSDKFFSIAGEYGNDVIIGMDIHNPKDFGNTKALKYCVDLADKYNLNLLRTLEFNTL